MTKYEQLGNYEAHNDQPQELQEALGRLAVTGDTLDLEYLRNGQFNKQVGAVALRAAGHDRDAYDLAS